MRIALRLSGQEHPFNRSYFERRIYLESDIPLAFPRLDHIIEYFRRNNIELSREENTLLTHFSFKEMDERYSRRQFAVLASLFIPFKDRKHNHTVSALIYILNTWGIRPEEVENIEMSYLNSGNDKSTYRFIVTTPSGNKRSFVIGVDKNTGFFREKHSKLEFKFLRRLRVKKLHFDALPNLLGFTVFKGKIAGKKERYHMIFKEYIEGQTADEFLSTHPPEIREKAVYQIGYQMGRFIAQFGGFPNDFHYKNVIVNILSDGTITVTFNDILGVIKNAKAAVYDIFTEIFIGEVEDDYMPFLNGFADGAGGLRGLSILRKYFSIMTIHPIVLIGSSRIVLDRFEEFKQQYVVQKNK